MDFLVRVKKVKENINYVNKKKYLITVFFYVLSAAININHW